MIKKMARGIALLISVMLSTVTDLSSYKRKRHM